MDKTSEELLWAIKNGELLIVKDVVEKQVNLISQTYIHFNLFIGKSQPRTLM